MNGCSRRRVQRRRRIWIGIYTSADLRDYKNIYLAHFGSQEYVWSGRVRPMVITVS